ncbi:sensor histidine kinase [Pseudoflavitalea sp. G-6-1-2]|uniref:sensor histidine kinase n=1 Tax=Pseudoflavitalea sp. G-6-1-2 TaxID=2728841 RepID=UPI00146B07E9|nr:sensor histidine kinase [Pseudoflavitalea sp. G-6-1-2]NML23199.1 sensor histidine kinase [Pseudoflavitalea sp. G-6-1-2]
MTNNHYLKPLLLLLTLVLALRGQAQNDSAVIDIAKIRLDSAIGKNCWFASLPKGTKIADSAIPYLPFKPGKLGRYMPHYPPSSELMEKDNYLRFAIVNNSDSGRYMFFLPGIYCRDIMLYKFTADKPEEGYKLQPAGEMCERFKGARLIYLGPNESAVYFCRFNFVRTNINIFTPYLIRTDYMNAWIMRKRSLDYELDIVTYVVAGVMLMMIFYSLAVYVQNRNKEFIYYAIYTLCTATLLFLKSFMSLSASWFHYFYEEYLDFMIMIASVFTYLIFVRKFLNTKENHPWLDKFLRITLWPLSILSLVFTILYFSTNKYIVLNNMEFVIKIFFFLIAIMFIVYSIKKNDTLLNYLAGGSFALIFFSIISQGIIMFGWTFSEMQLLNRALFYYEMGLVVELILFLSGLAYKNRRDIIERVKERERLKLENERKEFEKQMAVVTATQHERDRISADMHDELGSGVTAIRLMSEILKSRMKDQSFPELEKISNSANDLLGKMNTIIWTMKSSNDTVESLVAYIRAHAIEYFDNTHIDCTVRVPAVIPQSDISGEKRRNIFLSIKEALNNAIKHSQASKLVIEIIARDNQLMVRIADNGVGIDTEKLRRFGNGLSNMKRRMELIGGTFSIENDGGAVLLFILPL